MARRPYPTALTAAQWHRLAPLLPPAKPGGRRRTGNLREVLTASGYHGRGGASWRMLPPGALWALPPWGSGHDDYRRWRLDRTGRQLAATLHRQVRQAAGRDPEPSAGIIDGQRVKTTAQGGRAAMTRASR